MTHSDKNLLAELSADFESSDAVTRYNYIPDDTIYAESLDDLELFAELADDFESSDHNSRYNYIDEIEPFDMDGQAEPELIFDYISKTGENYYLFEATSPEPVKTPEPIK